MSVKEIKEAIENKNVYFGLKECVKHKKEIKNVYVTKNAREVTLQKLSDSKIDYKILKDKKEMVKLLNLDFFCEVFSIK